MIRNILLWFQERIYRWTKPATPPVSSDPLSDLSRSRLDLIAENAMLRLQIKILKRPADALRSSTEDDDSSS